MDISLFFFIVQLNNTGFLNLYVLFFIVSVIGMNFRTNIHRYLLSQDREAVAKITSILDERKLFYTRWYV